MRGGKELEDAINWFSVRGIPLFGIQRNPIQDSVDQIALKLTLKFISTMQL
jgi:hypothetical protein